MPEVDTHINDAVAKHSDVSECYAVQSRGRPARPVRESFRNIIRREKFGQWLRNLRLARGLTLQQASELSGEVSARRLAQYEASCYPPGEAIVALAQLYDIPPSVMALEMISHSDPDLYMCITQKAGVQVDEAEIDERIAADVAKKQKG